MDLSTYVEMKQLILKIEVSVTFVNGTWQSLKLGHEIALCVGCKEIMLYKAFHFHSKCCLYDVFHDFALKTCH